MATFNTIVGMKMVAGQMARGMKNNAKRLKALMENYYEARKEGAKYGYEIRLVEPDNYEHYYILVKPIAGVYKGQKYIMEMKTTYGRGEDQTTYPTNAPYTHFITSIFHVNISSNGGSICLDILKDKDKWSPLNSFDTIVQNILLLFNEPNNASPYNGTASKVWVECEKLYKELTNKKLSVEQCELFHMQAFKPFIEQALDVMKSNNYEHYATWFPELDPKHLEYNERIAKDEEEFKELETTVLSMKKKRVVTQDAQPTTQQEATPVQPTVTQDVQQEVPTTTQQEVPTIVPPIVPSIVQPTTQQEVPPTTQQEIQTQSKKKNRWAKYQKS